MSAVPRPLLPISPIRVVGVDRPSDARPSYPCIGVDDVHRFVEEQCFAGGGDGRVGAELEWLTFPSGDRQARVELATLDALAQAVGTLPAGSKLTFEPGGQVELSSQPATNLSSLTRAVAADALSLRQALGQLGVEASAMGLDPIRPDVRVLEGSRYVAMQAYFDSQGPAGGSMMCGTASVQVNLDVGKPCDVVERWSLAHALGPVMAAAFANSPFVMGAPSGLKSTRLARCLTMDPTRTTPVAHGPRTGSSWQQPATTWADYALNARVMMIHSGDTDLQPVLEPLTFADWMSRPGGGPESATTGRPLGYPDLDDLAYHLTTLFPPVRPKGWLELRMIDALPDPWWRVAAAVPAVLLDDPEAFAAAARATSHTAGRWAEAARHGLSHPGLASAARHCFSAALSALDRSGVDTETADACAGFNDRFVARGRCPADDLVEAWLDEGRLLPVAAGREPSWA